jgi:hypothetical protein
MELVPRAAITRRQVTLDAPEEGIVRVIFSEDLEMGVETVIVQIDVEAAAVALRTNLYVSAVHSRSQGKNCVVRNQSLLLLESLTAHRISGGFFVHLRPSPAGSKCLNYRKGFARLGRTYGAAVITGVPGQENQGGSGPDVLG